MTGNRSLDEFVPGAEQDSADDEGSKGDDGSADDGERTDDVESANAVDPDPIASTYAWSPEGAACADCGTVTERRWRDGDDLVCAGCKSW